MKPETRNKQKIYGTQQLEHLHAQTIQNIQLLNINFKFV